MRRFSSSIAARCMVASSKRTLRGRENTSDKPIRNPEVDLKDHQAASRTTALDPEGRQPPLQSGLRERQGAWPVPRTPREGQMHEHILNCVVLYLNDQAAMKADDVEWRERRHTKKTPATSRGPHRRRTEVTKGTAVSGHRRVDPLVVPLVPPRALTHRQSAPAISHASRSKTPVHTTSSTRSACVR